MPFLDGNSPWPPRDAISSFLALSLSSYISTYKIWIKTIESKQAKENFAGSLHAKSIILI
jgi:hypothetical protein